jgi:glutamine synthetase
LENVTKGKLSPKEKTDLKLNIIGKIPEILLDNTDINRTSPFAFTGNKFEFRAVGSSANCAGPITVLNTIVAKQLKEFKIDVDALIDTNNLKKDEAVFNVLREYIKASKKIRFDGDGYGETWEKEAKKRGLSNNKTTPEALKVTISKKVIRLYEEMNVMNKVEIEARYEIKLEEYTKRLQIESRVLGDISRNHVVPTAIIYQNTLLENTKNLKEIFGGEYKNIAKEQIELIMTISNHITEINSLVIKMEAERAKANAQIGLKSAAQYCNGVKPFFEQIRYHCDKLETMVDDNLWPLTKYRELLFTK